MKKALIASALFAVSTAGADWGYNPYGYSMSIGDTTYHQFNNGTTGYSYDMGGGMIYHQFPQQQTYQPQQPRYQGYQQQPQQQYQPYTWPAPAQVLGSGR